jgi:hypothetical protein
VPDVDPAACTAAAATDAACAADWAISRIEADISSAPATTLCTLPATCPAAATAPERAGVVSAVRAISSLVDASPSAERATPAEVSATSRTVCRVRAVAASRAADLRPISSREAIAAAAVRSPSASPPSTVPMRRSGVTMCRTVSRATVPPSSTPAPSTAMSVARASW